MEYKQLYHFVESAMLARQKAGQSTVALIVEIKAQMLSEFGWIADINFWPVKCKEGDPHGHFECHGDAESAYEEPDEWVVLITFNSELNMCKKRFVWCKELMHAFDDPDGSVKNESDYRELLEEIEIKPLEPSDKYISENWAKWMALLILCPKTFRDEIVGSRKDGTKTDYEIAFDFRIPESIVKSLFSQSYDDAYKALIQT